LLRKVPAAELEYLKHHSWCGHNILGGGGIGGLETLHSGQGVRKNKEGTLHLHPISPVV
jgi:hypothetical protein